ncbi:MAG: hypothetical protein FWG66_01265 [Spirochaetes bacterium]|nr:hypothetical protein [Spirochaetota bacterium]
MGKIIAAVIFFALPMSLFAQSREDTMIFVAPVVAEPAQAAFLHEHFTMEVLGANYSVTDLRSQSDFVIALEVMENLLLFEGGVIQRAPEGQPQYLLQLALIDNNLNFEMLSFSMPFTELEDIFEFSLTMVYQAMANVPVTRLGDFIDDDSWRNMWLYFRASFDFPVITVHSLQEPLGVWSETGEFFAPLNHNVRPVPGATLGVELHFLDWVSAEFAFSLRFGDPEGYSFIPGVGVQLKFPLKPGTAFKISPYLMFNRTMNTATTSLAFPSSEIGLGIQLATRGHRQGAFFIDVNFLYALGNVVMPNNNPTLIYPTEIIFSRYSIGIGIGYKVGFFERLPPFRRR